MPLLIGIGLTISAKKLWRRAPVPQPLSAVPGMQINHSSMKYIHGTCNSTKNYNSIGSLPTYAS